MHGGIGKIISGRTEGVTDLKECRLSPLAQRTAISLMHATQVATPFHRPGWVYEEKVDGYRIAALKTREAVNLISRNGIHHAKRFPELVQALDALPVDAFILGR
jgi:ATP-dependent DNA ligase